MAVKRLTKCDYCRWYVGHSCAQGYDPNRNYPACRQALLEYWENLKKKK